MAIVRVQGPFRGSSLNVNVAVALGVAPTNGNYLVATIANFSGAPGVASVVQAGVVWALVISKVQGTISNEIWLGTVGAGAVANIAITVNAGTVAAVADVCEYSGLNGVVDQTASVYGFTGVDPTVTTTGTTAATTVDNELVVAGVMINPIAGAPQSQGTVINGFTLLDGSGLGPNVDEAFLEKIVAVTGAQNSGTTASGGAATEWIGVIATFEESPLVNVVIDCIYSDEDAS